ncbi:MAG: imidazoleglycerol-phosphate dehydratase [Phenylobacterium sp. RIFCSPHIGHO2_01_FULL_69_31]|jgi:imidazoleglycerol-phosphate dehydratase|uniref:imidazoleglycerol-phosphate dehydratase HisB n=1 Tax=Phenylobacterium sp. RIFCSPHIGHO2_01_FULL_69_31 TaxID=1801944 RepID=UPI0008D09168|nr:imidazoleglycerol-phosphate dehydratase HisB [Phenylobacterium sp. RIFCSPHIGHO2_01_FULL_69_31]OHB29611.1 MAG: imidazoleglycerol-phosphate dehydratase [Phenylobacterium sp. RIFCSPHIGHO2_01_FULL_69_31]
MSRKAEVVRNTKETQIRVAVDLDGVGNAKVSTGIGFFDHMLDSFARHGGIDIEVETKGDLHIDMHHTVEDTGIVLGRAIKEALDGFKGIRRFGHAYIPMDETLSRCAIDFSNRPYLIWKVEFRTPKVGDMDTELFKEFHHAFAMNGGACVHLETLYGANSHHIAESGFKALARAVRQAVEIDPKTHGHAPSTKGVL